MAAGPHRSKVLFGLAMLAVVLGSCRVNDDGGLVGGDPGTTLPDRTDEIAVCEVDEVDGDLFLYNWSDYIDPQLVSKFEAEFEVDVVIDTYDSDEALLAKLQSGAVYDLVVPSDRVLRTMIEGGLVTRLQSGALPNIRNLDSFFTNPVYDPEGSYSVPYLWGTTGLGIDVSVVGEDFEPSWGLAFDPELVSEYPIGISLLDDPRETLGAALKYLGYSLNSTSEVELQEAADVIAGIEEYVAVFDESSPGELLAGRVVVSHGDSTSQRRAISESEEAASRYTYVTPKEGGTLRVDAMAVPADADHPCTAHSFINFLLEAENGAALANWSRQASPNQAAEAFILPEILADESIYPDDSTRAELELISDLADFEDRYADFLVIARS